jgi:ethanolamine utilization microcompartment shell protein EutL
MKLDQFISQTLISVVEGISKANKEVFENKKLSQHSDPFSIGVFGEKQDDAAYINFDIAVTVASEVAADVKGGGDIVIASLDTSAEISRKNENVSRVKFKILYR